MHDTPIPLPPFLKGHPRKTPCSLYPDSKDPKEAIDKAPALLRDLAEILESNPGIDLATTNSKLQLLGWNGVRLDYQSLQLALAWMGRQAGNKQKSPLTS